MNPLEALYEAPDIPSYGLPPELGRLYGGALGFDETCVYANFISTLDGVVAIPSIPDSNSLIAAGSRGERVGFPFRLVGDTQDNLPTLASCPGALEGCAEVLEGEHGVDLRVQLGQ